MQRWNSRDAVSCRYVTMSCNVANFTNLLHTMAWLCRGVRSSSHVIRRRSMGSPQCYFFTFRISRLFHIELWTDHHIVHRRDLSMEMYLRVLQKAITWPLRLCMIILDTFYWLRNHIKHTKRPNRQCWRFFEPKSPKSRSLIQSPEIVENLMFRAAEIFF